MMLFLQYKDTSIILLLSIHCTSDAAIKSFVSWLMTRNSSIIYSPRRCWTMPASLKMIQLSHASCGCAWLASKFGSKFGSKPPWEDVPGFEFTTRPTCPTHYDVADQWFTRPQFFFTTSTFKSNLRTYSTRYPIPQFFWRSCKINCMFILYFLYFSS